MTPMKKFNLGTLIFRGLGAACFMAIAYILIAKSLAPAFLMLSMALGIAGVASIVLPRFINPELRDAIGLSLLSGIAALYVAEFYFSPEPDKIVEVAYSTDHDRRTMHEVVTQLRAKGDKSAVPIIYPSYLLTRPDLFSGQQLTIDNQPVLPLSGMSSRTTVLCNESGYWAIYASDEFGFHNPKGLWGGNVDIAVVGDSFSHGNCVRSGEDWVSLLREFNPRSLNFGMGGNGPLFELASIKEYLPAIKPKIVIWEYFEANDTRISAEETLPILKRYLFEPNFRQGIGNKQKQIDDLLERIVERALEEHVKKKGNSRNILAAEFIRLGNLRTRLGIQFGQSKSALSTLALTFAEGNRVVNEWGGQLYLVYLPSMQGLAGQSAPHYSSREAVIATAKEQNLQVIDLYSAMKSHPDPASLFPYRGPFHYNSEGYRLVAKKVIERLTQDLKAPPKP